MSKKSRKPLERLKSEGFDTSKYEEILEKEGVNQKKRQQNSRKITGSKGEAVLAAVTTPNAGLQDRMLELSKQIQNSRIHSLRLTQAMTLRRNTQTGELLPWRLTMAQRKNIEATKSVHDTIEDEKLNAEAKTLCKEHPAWDEFLRRAGGVTAATAIHLLGRINIQQAEKPSQLKAYCGVRCGPGGRLIRRTAGVKLSYDSFLRSVLYTMADSRLRRLGAYKKGTNILVDVNESKLVRYAYEKLHSMAHGPQFHAASKLYIQGPVEGIPLVRAYLDKGGSLPKGKDLGAIDPSLAGCRVSPPIGAMLGALRWKILSLFLDDLYVVWRSIEGLPVWPTWYDRSRMHTHGGVSLPSLGPRIWTPEEWGKIRDDYVPRPMSPAVTELAHWWAEFKARVASKEELLALETMGEGEGEDEGKEAAE